MPFKQGAKVVGAARKTFMQNRSMHGTFGAIGAMGKKNVSTMSTEQLARSGKIRSAMVAGGAVGMGAMRNRRGPGTSRTSGRPTGMYGY